MAMLDTMARPMCQHEWLYSTTDLDAFPVCASCGVTATSEQEQAYVRQLSYGRGDGR